MASKNINQGFVGIPTLISEVQYGINDTEEKRYYGLALQKILNAIRNLNVHHVRSYKEKKILLSEDLMSGKYPDDLVKLISVGVYKNGEYWGFSRKPNMAKTVTGDGEAYDEDFNENDEIPDRGIKFGARSSNIGYWVEDDENRRFFVRNYVGIEGVDDKYVLARYRSNGIDCTVENCVPYLIRDLVVSMVVYEFALKRIPYKHTAVELQYLLMERTRHYEEFTDIEYIPQDMEEFMDSQFNSYNSTVRRGL